MKEQAVREWTGFSWLRIGSNRGRELSGSIQARDISLQSVTVKFSRTRHNRFRYTDWWRMVTMTQSKRRMVASSTVVLQSR